MSCHRQKSSVNLPGSPGALATRASGPGLARTASMAAAAAATSLGSRAERTQTTPSRANASANSATPGISSIGTRGTVPPGPPPLPLSIATGAYLGILSAGAVGPAASLPGAVGAERVGTEEGQQPGVCLKEGGRRARLDRGQILQVRPDVGDQPGHPGHQGARVGEALQVT